MFNFTDQIGNTILLEKTPRRIVSLVPSQTELLYSLGLDDNVVGITKFCIHPNNWYQNKTRVGGTKNIDFDKIQALNPDLIIANKEENTENEIKSLITKYPVYVSDINDLNSALGMIRDIGEITQTKIKATSIIENITERFNKFNPVNSEKSVLYLIWKNPYMTVSKDTFIHDMLLRNKWNNCTAKDNERYPQVSVDSIKELNPDLILLSSEPFPFKEKHIAELKQIVPKSEIHLVDGEMFSWYGSRLLYSVEYFSKLHQNINLQ